MLFHALMQLLIKTARLKVENSAQTTLKLSPVRYRTPQQDANLLKSGGWGKVEGEDLAEDS